MMSRKGISPLIAAILLIGFTIAVAALLASWSTTFARERTEEFTRAETASECQFANLQIETAIYDNSEDKIVAVIWNMGKIELSNFQFLVYYSDVNISSVTPTEANRTLSTGDFHTFTAYNVNSTPEKLQVRSMDCPTESIFTCIYSSGKFNC